MIIERSVIAHHGGRTNGVLASARPRSRRCAANVPDCRLFLAHGDATVRRCGLTPQRYLLLLAVKGAPDGTETRTIGGIAADLQLAQSSATELVNRAVAAGLVVRTSSPQDGRVVTITLSEAGEARFVEAFAALGGDRAELLGYLDHARRHLAGPAAAVRPPGSSPAGSGRSRRRR